MRGWVGGSWNQKYWMEYRFELMRGWAGDMLKPQILEDIQVRVNAGDGEGDAWNPKIVEEIQVRVNEGRGRGMLDTNHTGGNTGKS